MSNSVKVVLKSFILLAYIFIILSILENHYVAMGECAARIYYYPLSRWDYILIPLVGVILLSLSLCFIHASLKMRIIEGLLYSCIVITTLIWGNNILASPTIDWPEVYHPTPLISQELVVEDIKMIHGKWVINSGKIESDCFLTDTISFGDDNIFYNQDSSFQYTYNLRRDSLFVYRPNQALQIFKVISLTNETLEIKWIGEQTFEISLVIISPVKKSDTLKYNQLKEICF